VLLRGINLGPSRRIAMPALRELLGASGLEDVRTYVQSGNVVLSSDAPPGELAAQCEQLIAQRFGFEVEVVTRTRDELAEIVSRDPLADVAENPKRYVVHFLSQEPDRGAVSIVAELAEAPERVLAIGRELYSWHPDGIARSRLAAQLARQGSLGATVTARNWSTVTKLLAIADE
jgi:uncharacterized protein (DUF1697 family)